MGKKRESGFDVHLREKNIVLNRAGQAVLGAVRAGRAAECARFADSRRRVFEEPEVARRAARRDVAVRAGKREKKKVLAGMVKS